MAPDYITAAAAAGFEVEEPDEMSEPPMPSWMASTKAEEVQLEERTVDAPPATPPEWSPGPGPAEGRTYGYRRPEEGKEPAYKGAGRPR